MEINMSVLVEVSRQLNIDSVEMWKYMVQGQIIAGLVQIIFIIYVLMLSIAGGMIGRKWYLANCDEINYSDYIWSISVGGLSGLLIGIVSSIPMYQAVLRIFAPEYMAVRELLKTLAGS